jgi:hypothetical protein
MPLFLFAVYGRPDPMRICEGAGEVKTLRLQQPWQ